MQEFKAGDKVEFIYGTGSTREMQPPNIKMAISICDQYGCTRFEIYKVENIPEEERDGVGHHQRVFLQATGNGMFVKDSKGKLISFSGYHFTVVKQS